MGRARRESPAAHVSGESRSRLLRLTMELHAQFVGGSAQRDAAGGGRAREGGAAEEDVGAVGRLGYGVGQRGQALAAVDALV